MFIFIHKDKVIIIITMEKQNHEIRVKLTQEQMRKIKEKSTEAGLTPSAFLRYLGLKSKVAVSFE